MRLLRRRHRHPPVIFEDDLTREPLPVWAVRAGMLIVQTDYECNGRSLRVRVQHIDRETARELAKETA